MGVSRTVCGFKDQFYYLTEWNFNETSRKSARFRETEKEGKKIILDIKVIKCEETNRCNEAEN